MFSFFGRLLGLRTSPRRRPTTRRTVSRRLECEDLESRLVLSVSAPELHINSFIPYAQSQSASAAARTTNPAQAGYGRSVVAWTSQGLLTVLDVKAQILDGFGNKVGGEITLAGGSAVEYEPSVAMDDQGRFVAAWTEINPSNGQLDVKARRFDAAGQAIGAAINVAVDPQRNEFDPSVAVNGAGDFVVSYTRAWTPTDLDVMAKMYSFNNPTNPTNTIPVAQSLDKEHHSSIARTTDGRFAVAYAVGTTSVHLTRYGPTGNLVDTQVIDWTNGPYVVANPNLAMDNAGNCVVVDQHEYSYNQIGFQFDVMARRVRADGSSGALLNVTGHSTASEQNPVVALDPTNGKFVVAYESSQFTFEREVSASDVVAPSYSFGTSGGLKQQPAVSIGGNHKYTVTYTLTQDELLDLAGGIFGKRGTLA